MNYQYQLFIYFTNKAINHYYNNVKYFVKDIKNIIIKDKSKLEGKLK